MTSTTAPLPDVAGLDLAATLANMGGNAALLRRLARLFIEQHGADVSRIDAALGDRDFGLALHLVHALRGTAGNLGAPRVHAAARAFENELKAREREPSGAPAELAAAMAELVPALPDWLTAPA